MVRKIISGFAKDMYVMHGWCYVCMYVRMYSPACSYVASYILAIYIDT